MSSVESKIEYLNQRIEALQSQLAIKQSIIDEISEYVIGDE